MAVTGSKTVMSETVVALSADIDNAGIQKLFSLLDTHRLKAYTLAATVAAVTTGVYKLMESFAKEELELEKLAKKQNKSIANTRAQQEALEAMGVTLNDINKDAALKGIYDDILKFNEAMKLSNVQSAMKNVQKFRVEFYKLRSAVNYAVKEISAQVLTNLEMPIDRVTGKLRNVAEWIRDNLHIIGMRVGSFITAFSKGIIGIGETVGKVFTWLQGMPESIKGIALAAGSLFLLLKTGPLGRILAGITIIGDLIHDYEVNKYNRENGKDIPVAFKGIWDILDSDAPGDEKASKIATTILGGLGDAMEGAFRDFDMAEVFEGSGDNPGLIKKITDWFNTNQTLVQSVGTSFITFIARGISTVGGYAGGAMGKIIDAIFGDGTVDARLYTGQGSAGASLAGGLGGFVSGVLDGIKSGGQFHEVFFKGIKGGLLGSIITALVSNIRVDENGEVMWQESFNGMVGDLSVVGQTVVNLVCKAIATVDNVGSMVFTAIATAIKGAIGGDGKDQVLKPLADTFDLLGKEDSIFGKAISEGIVAGFVSGNGIVGLITGLTKVVAEAIANPTQFTAEVQALADTLGEFFNIIWDGALDENGNRKGGMLKDLLFGKDENGKNTGWLAKLWEGEDGSGGLQSVLADVAGKITGWLVPVGDAIKNFFSNLWTDIFNNLPGWMKTIFGLKDPNTSTVSQDENTGEVTVQSTTGAKKTYAKGGISSNAQAILNRYGGFFTIDDDGKVTMTNGAEEMVVKGYGMQRGAGDRTIPLQSVLQYIISNGILPGEGNREGVRFGGDSYLNADSFEQLFNNTFSKGKPLAEVMPKVDIASIQTQIDSGSYHVNADVNLSDGEKKEGKAWGGRIGSEGTYRVGEDGTEYIIPITKPERAFSLIHQMISEMGSSAIGRVMEGFGIGGSGSVGASPSNLTSALQGMTMANTYNITAPINISVVAQGADGREIGTTVYDMAQKNLIRNIVGVMG